MKTVDKEKSPLYKAFYGVPAGIRTQDLLIRSQTLYPAELRAHRINARVIIMDCIYNVNNLFETIEAILRS